jgi:hypothetical protein
MKVKYFVECFDVKNTGQCGLAFLVLTLVIFSVLYIDLCVLHWRFLYFICGSYWKALVSSLFTISSKIFSFFFILFYFILF